MSTRRVCSRISGPLIRMPSCSAAPCSDHQCCRRCEPECAWAGDDQNRHGCRERLARRSAKGEPAAERAEREHDHDRDKDGRNAVGETLHGSLARLGGVHEPRDLCKRRLGAHTGGTNDEPAVGVDRRARDARPRGDLDRDRFAGQHRLVDRRLALDDLAVRCDLLSRSHDEQVTDRELVHGDEALLAVPQDARLFGTDLEQLADRLRRVAFRAALEVPAQHDQRCDDSRHLEVGVGVEPSDQDDRRPSPGRQGAQGDERVHRGCQMASVPECGPMEGCTGVRREPARRARTRPTPAPRTEVAAPSPIAPPARSEPPRRRAGGRAREAVRRGDDPQIPATRGGRDNRPTRRRRSAAPPASRSRYGLWPARSRN